MVGKAVIGKAWHALAGFFRLYLPFRIWKLTTSPALNKILFPLRNRIRWSRGRPRIPRESKDELFRFLGQAEGAAQVLETSLRSRYDLAAFSEASSRFLYLRNLNVIEQLESATEGLALIPGDAGEVKALDIGSRAWEYVIGLEKWLRHHNRSGERRVRLHGVELDGHMLLQDLHSIRDYALCFAGLTGNPDVTYEVRDMLRLEGGDYDIITHFYPLILRKNLIGMGLPAEFLAPERMIDKAAELTRPGGHLVVFNHHAEEREIFCELAAASGKYILVRRGEAEKAIPEPGGNGFSAFYADRLSGLYSVWKKPDQP